MELILAVLFLILALKFAGVMLAVGFWLVIRVPMGLALIAMGAALCCTLILIPIGVFLVRLGADLIFP